MSDDHVRTAALTRFSSWRTISKAVRRCLLSNRIIQRDASNDSNADRAADFLLARRAGDTHGGVELRQVFDHWQSSCSERASMEPLPQGLFTRESFAAKALCFAKTMHRS